MTSTYTSNKHLEQPALGDDINTWYTPLNTNFTTIDSALAGSTTITTLGSLSSPYVYSATQAQMVPSQIVLSGSITNATYFNIPNGIGGSWVFNTILLTGSVALYIQNGTTTTSPSGAYINLPLGVTSTVYSDGTNWKIG